MSAVSAASETTAQAPALLRAHPSWNSKSFAGVNVSALSIRCDVNRSAAPFGGRIATIGQ